MIEINLIVLRTSNPKDLAEFYSQLGIKFIYHQHGTGSWHYSSEIKKLVFEIYPLLKNQEEADKSLRLGFEVQELDALILKLKKKKVEILREPKESEWGYFAIVKDLDGRKIELKESA